MISATRCLFYEVDGQFFKSLDEAQKADLKKLVPEQWVTVMGKDSQEVVADWLLANKDALVDCLTTTPTSRLKARKSHGAVRIPRKPKAAPAEGSST